MSATPLEPQAPVKLEEILMRAWRLFRANVITALPIAVLTAITFAIIASVAAAVVLALAPGQLALATAQSQLPTLHAAHAGASRGESVPASVIWLAVGVWLAAVVVGCCAQAWIYAVIYGLANAQWESGSATLAAGFSAGCKRFGAVFVSGIGFVGLAIAALVLALPTLFLSFLALVLFTMYVLPAAVGGGRAGFAAIRESFQLVRHAFGTSAIALLILWAIQQGISFLAVPFILPLQFGFMFSAANNDPTPHVALWLIAVAAGGYVLIIGASCAYVGYMALVQTGLYHALRARQEIAVATSSVPAIPQP